jgi:FkbM family methyltransferase
LNLQLLRRFFLPLLKLFAFDFTLQHHWVPEQRFKLNSFKHKGYWYSGRRREEKSMLLFEILLQHGMTVAEVGGHIGYISLHFAKIVGSLGKVVVFEPGHNNLPYIRFNLKQVSNIKLEEFGVASIDGELTLVEESLSGQNNTFAKDFEGLETNRKKAYVDVSVRQRTVPVLRLDSYFSSTKPDFIKVDVEGFEYEVLRGAERLLKEKTMLMVEVQSHHREIYELLNTLDYAMFNENRERIRQPSGLQQNVFCLHLIEHKKLLEKLGI